MCQRAARLAALLLLALGTGRAGPAGAQPVVPIEPLAAARIVVTTGGSRAEVSGELPLTLPFGLSNASCSAVGTATLAQIDDALQIDVRADSLAGSFLSQPCSLGFSGAFVDRARIRVPRVGDRMTPLLGYVQQEFSGTANIRFTDWSGALQGRAFSEILPGEIPDATLRSSVSPLIHQLVPLLRVVSFFPGDRVVFEASEAGRVGGQADNGGGSLGAGGSFEASVRFVVMLPPRAGPTPLGR